MADIPVLDEAKLDALGVRLAGVFQTYETDRKAAEDKWLKNLRQFRGIYDPEILAMIGSDQSKAYPKLTRWKCIGTIARLMQMLFPQTEKNYGLRPSPMPDLTLDQMQKVLDGLVAEKAQEDGVDPAQVQLTDEEIEKAIVKFAAGKAERMELKIDDDLEEMEYITLARKVVFSAVLYNIGVLKGPMHTKVKARTWSYNEFRGKYEAKEVDKYKPLYEFLPVWNYYPDMSATSLATQDGSFERHVMSRWQVEKLADRPDFLAPRVNKWLLDHPTGNYTERHWETAMKGEPKGDRTTASTSDGRKYEIIFYFGGVTGRELRAAGATVAEGDLGKTLQAHVAMLGNVVVKAKLAPFGSDVRQHHEFVFEEDDLSLLGNGQCDTLRDSQLSICETTRAALDNMSVIGPMVEINDDLLTPGQDISIRKHKVWRREGTGNEANMPAIRPITINSHLNELSALLEVFTSFADKESGLPPSSLGDVSGGGSEALRTQGNASMFLGAAALPIRDTVRNFDTFTISVISALVQWNKKYDPNPSRDGDFNTIARGSTSLIAKEVLGVSLDNFRTTLSPDEAPHIKTRKLLEFRARARDIPIEEILEDEDVAEASIAATREAQTKQAATQEALVQAEVEKTLANAFAYAAKARKDDASINVEMFNAIIDGIHGGAKLEAGMAKATNQGGEKT